jgi:ATP-binding cassette subfamily B protein
VVRIVRASWIEGSPRGQCHPWTGEVLSVYPTPPLLPTGAPGISPAANRLSPVSPRGDDERTSTFLEWSVLISLLRRYLPPYRSALIAVVVLQFFGTLAALYLPTLNADIIDNGVAKADTSYILRVGGVMLAVTVVQVACTIGAVWFGARSAMGFGRDTRAAIFHQVGTYSAREVTHFGAPSLITRTTNDVQQVQMLVLLTCTMMVAAPIMAVGGVVMALRQDIGLAPLIIVSVSVLVVAIALIVSRMVPLFRRMQKRLDNVNRVLREQITGIRVVRAFVREPVERERFELANADLTDVAIRVGRLMALMFPIVMFVLNASSVAVIWFGGHRIDSGEMQVGSLTAFLSYLVQILMSIMMATFMLVLIPRAAVSAERITEVLDTESSVVPTATPVGTVVSRGTVEFRGATFRYPGADDPVLSDITFTASAGQTTAIIGSTGSGKTTLLSLVPRLFDVTEGAVLVDGVDVRDLDPEVLHSRIGLVPQKAYLFSGTVASNLRYGREDATDEELWEALRIAQADDFVAALADGLEAPVAQGGTNFSGGQRQRLAIARAVVRRPEIYLFDDSFSALDLATDARLRAALRPTTRESTVLVVAQRVSSVVDADQILVLDGGRLVGVGTHDELIASCPTYAEIVQSQLPAEVAA